MECAFLQPLERCGIHEMWNSLMIQCVSENISPMPVPGECTGQVLDLRPVWFLDSTDHDPVPASLCSVALPGRGGVLFPRQRGALCSGGRGASPGPHVIHEGLHPLKLVGQLPQTLLQGVELLVQVSQGIGQRGDPGEGEGGR